LHAGILLAPVVERGLGDAVLSADVAYLASGLNFGNYADDLVVGEVGLFHGSPK
jgi:hypothetical protein